MASELILPDTSRVVKQANEALLFAREAVVNDDHSYSVIGDFLAGLKDLRREIDQTFDPIIKAQHAAWKLALAKKAEHSKPVEEAERIVSEKMGAYRLEAERRAKEEEERQRREALEAVQKARLEQAVALEEQGRKAEAEAILNAPVIPPAVQVQGPPQVEGLAVRKRWTFRIVDPTLLPREYLMPDETKIRGVVARLGPDAKIPGVEVLQAVTLARFRS